ncbi:hypothetical protein KAFR_0B06360 [Kazachstania africana CBS 2517]|uniref:C2H2-type domain-containing protein n=1 Tax=Kazachstania africana (strain ATCC 22294 / BCRC 22015 / CBS 2517 / CECT 1963 / NBRC 1671 / NRRL Y-8276) TaxID=1071382 RepID=H2ARD2_KAZAF|nr:hypothetical protein KAFR_0B06360 [Kazachstania africana CBS 2517]CCF56932.1 hypothetical protein KAFR_0B06360 [Kazachstania africana CBS 2517]
MTNSRKLDSQQKYTTSSNNMNSKVNKNLDTIPDNLKLNGLTPSGNKRTFLCFVCQKAFARQEHLDRHLRSHTNEKPFKCAVCDKDFTRRDLLIRHSNKLHSDTAIVQRKSCNARKKLYRRASFSAQSGDSYACKKKSSSKDNEIKLTFTPPCLQSVHSSNVQTYTEFDTDYFDSKHLDDQFLMEIDASNTKHDSQIPIEFTLNDQFFSQDLGIDDFELPFIRSSDTNFMDNTTYSDAPMTRYSSTLTESVNIEFDKFTGVNFETFSPNEISSNQLGNNNYNNTNNNFGSGNDEDTPINQFDNLSPMEDVNIENEYLQCLDSNFFGPKSQTFSELFFRQNTIRSPTVKITDQSDRCIFNEKIIKYCQIIIDKISSRSTDKLILPSSEELNGYLKLFNQKFLEIFKFIPTNFIKFDFKSYLDYIFEDETSDHVDMIDENNFLEITKICCLPLLMATFGSLIKLKDDKRNLLMLYEISQHSLLLYLENKKRIVKETKQHNSEHCNDTWLIQSLILNISFPHFANELDKFDSNLLIRQVSALSKMFKNSVIKQIINLNLDKKEKFLEKSTELEKILLLSKIKCVEFLNLFCKLLNDHYGITSEQFLCDQDLPSLPELISKFESHWNERQSL